MVNRPQYLLDAEVKAEQTRITLEAGLKAKNEAYCKVTAFIVDMGQDNVAIGYFQEPNRLTKMRAMDLLTRSESEAGDLLLTACLLPDSDTRIMNPSPENDVLYMTFLGKAQELVTWYATVIKKN